MSAPTSRRGVLLGLAALPAAGVAAAPPADPHVALAEEALALWRVHKASAWGWACPYNSPEDERASNDHLDLIDHCWEAAELPPPTTLQGLGALALMMALQNEAGWSAEECESMKEHNSVRLLEMVLRVAGVTLPEGFAGLVHRPDQGSSDGGVA